MKGKLREGLEEDMFDPAKLSASRASAAARRNIAAWANASMTEDIKVQSTLSVREVNCTDPACATPDGLEVVISLTNACFSLTEKILKRAQNCTRNEVGELVRKLCEEAAGRFIAARARVVVEAEDERLEVAKDEKENRTSSPPNLSEVFAARVLSRLNEVAKTGIHLEGTDGVAEHRRNMIALARVLQSSLAIKIDELREAADPSKVGNTSSLEKAVSGVSGKIQGLGSAGTNAATSTSREPTPSETSTSTSSTSSASTPSSSNPAPSRARPRPMMELGDLEGRKSRLLESDGDEASAVLRHNGVRPNCPCCNPDDPRVLMDKLLM